MPKTKLEFTIGDSVYFDRIVKIIRKGTERRIKTNSVKPSFGVICGAKRLFEGTIAPSYSSYYEGGYNLISDNSVIVYLVRKGMLNKPLMVLQGDVMYVPSTEEKIPLLSGNWCKWTDEWKEALRKDMKDYPRDSKGRWLSWEIIRKRQKLSGS